MIAYNDDSNNLIELGGKTTSMYGICTSPANASVKSVLIPDLTSIKTGTTIRIKFAYNNTTDDPSLNVNNLGSKPIYSAGGGSVGNSWKAGAVVQLTFDGTAWMIMGEGEVPVATTSVAGIVKPDGQSITIEDGVISAVTSGGRYSLAGTGKALSISSNVVNTNIDLHREPKSGDRLLLYCNTRYDGPTGILVYNNGVAVTLNYFIVEPYAYLYGMCLIQVDDNPLGGLMLTTLFTSGYTAGSGINIVNNEIRNTMPQRGDNISGVVISNTVSDGNLNNISGGLDYVIFTFKSYASPDSDGIYHCLISYSSPVARFEMCVLKTLSDEYFSKKLYPGMSIICHLEPGHLGTDVDPKVLTVLMECGGYIQIGKIANTLVGDYTTIEGWENTGTGLYAHVEGNRNTVSESCSHAEGRETTASNYQAHAEGYRSTASGQASHAEGMSSQASKVGAHAEGSGSIADGDYAHAEGQSTQAYGIGSHAEGNGTTAAGDYTHASGTGTYAGHVNQTAIGSYNFNKDDTLLEIGNGDSFSTASNALEVYADGKISQDNGQTKFKFGNNGTADGYYDANDEFHEFGSGGGGGGLPENPLAAIHGGTGNTAGLIQSGKLASSTIGSKATAEGEDNVSSGYASHAEGNVNYAEGDYSHVEGFDCRAEGLASHAEGNSVIASGSYSHAEGGFCDRHTSDPLDNYVKAAGDYSHAEGGACHALGMFSHAEGLMTDATGGSGSHAEGYLSVASGANAHSEGYKTTASSSCTHAGGTNSIASGLHSFAHGQYVTAQYPQQTALGRYNVNTYGTLLEVGNGTSASARSNAFTVWESGDIQSGRYVLDSRGNNLIGVNSLKVQYSGNPIILEQAIPQDPKDITIRLDVTQQGSGDPSPSNIRPFVTRYYSAIFAYDENGSQISYMGMGFMFGVTAAIVDFKNNRVGLLTDDIYEYEGQTISGRWWSDRDVYVPGTTPTIGAHVLVERNSPYWLDASYNDGQLSISDGYNRLKADGTITISLYPYEVPTFKYSAEEHAVGTWKDGSMLYEKTIDCGALPNATTKTVNCNINSRITVVDIKGVSRRVDNVSIPLPSFESSSDITSISFYSDNTNNINYIKLTTTANKSNFIDTNVTIQYTKTV